jgi:hypothetical protein
MHSLKSKQSEQKVLSGSGLINNLIDNLGVEVHLPGGYQFCVNFSV